MARKKAGKRDIYQEVTDKIVGYLETGTVPWQNPILGGSGDGRPKNLASGKRYRGINVFLLGMRAWESGFDSDYWLTFKQAREKGGSVRKGEQGSLVTFWKMYEKRDEKTQEEITLPILKHYHVFNLDQIDGIDAPDVPIQTTANSFTPIEKADEIVSGYVDGPTIKKGGSRACYCPAIDTVKMPPPEKFTSSEASYVTLFHELSHSTGHPKRLDRGFDGDPSPFGSPDYGREELVAELSASYCCAASGISPATIEQSSAYLQGWIKALKGDKRLLVSAAGAAQKSADLILGESFECDEHETETNNQQVVVNQRQEDVQPRPAYGLE